MTQPPDDAALVADETRLLHMGPMPGGGFGMELEGGPIPAIGEYLANMLGMRTDTPSNYVQMDIHRADLGWMTLTLQRQSGKTPHQLRVEAETALAEAATALEAKDRRIAELEERLKPFAEITHGEVYERFKTDSRSTFRISNGDGSRHLAFINAECFDASRAALEPSDKGMGSGR